MRRDREEREEKAGRDKEQTGDERESKEANAPTRRRWLRRSLTSFDDGRSTNLR